MGTGRKLCALVCALALVAVAAGAAIADQSTASMRAEGNGLKLVANIKYDSGTDMEFLTWKGRDFAITGDRGGEDGGAVRVIDITKPQKPKVAATLRCSLNQADIQISHDRKTLIVAADAAGGPDSCLMLGKLGFMTIDISNPTKPKPIGVAEIRRGSHNTTAHPTKPFVYNSDSDLGGRGEIQIWSIKNPAKPKLVNTVASLPHSPHDIAFNKKGTLAVTAAISHWDIYDTSDPKNPTLLWTGQCPGCSITHDAKFTPDGSHIFIGDEGGGGATYPCPGGALYAYAVQGGESNPVPVLVGAYEPDEFVASPNGPGGCTSHVMDISDDSKLLSISWYTAGTRLLDISEPTGVAVGTTGGGGIQEVASILPEGGSSWSSKMYKGPYVYSNDIRRGFDVFKITADVAP